jgi:hypothetical protein
MMMMAHNFKFILSTIVRVLSSSAVKGIGNAAVDAFRV